MTEAGIILVVKIKVAITYNALVIHQIKMVCNDQVLEVIEGQAHAI